MQYIKLTETPSGNIIYVNPGLTSLVRRVADTTYVVIQEVAIAVVETPEEIFQAIEDMQLAASKAATARTEALTNGAQQVLFTGDNNEQF